MNAFETAKVLFHRGMEHLKREEWDRAEACLRDSLKLVPDRPSTLNNLSALLLKQKKFDEAEAFVERALSVDRNMAAAWANRGLLLTQRQQFTAALESCDRAIELEPGDAEAYLSRAIVLKALEQQEMALKALDRALELNPNLAEAHNNRANVLRDLGRPEEALSAYERALALKPGLEYLDGARLHARMVLCDWRDFESLAADLFSRIERGEKATTCFPMLALTDSPRLQRKAAEIWAADKYPAKHVLPPVPRRAKGKKVRLGYYSTDYREHAVAFLTAELYELHDRTQFDVIAFSLGPDTSDGMRKRLSAAFDEFIDVRGKSEREIAVLSREREIDIAIDLNGFTQRARTGIFSHRAAPIQVGYLGYPATTGAEYMDYLVADHTVIPEKSRHHYSEKIAYLPHCFQPHDRKRVIVAKAYSREELGLPAEGFVFCCFNNSYKILPATFDGWMRILDRVEGSVLWLLEDNRTAADNLRREAEKREVDPNRLVFAPRVSPSEHLARHRAADLFIDSLPCNAGTTASDALWMGVPVLTRAGETIAGRMAASLLNAVSLQELVTDKQETYESLAVELATNSARFKAIKERLDQNRLTAPLFDTPRFTRYLEGAYLQMHERYQARLPPDHIYVQP